MTLSYRKSVKNILIVAPYSTLPGEQFVNRFSFLARYLSNVGYKVSFVTSAFSHSRKIKRCITSEEKYENLEICLIDEPGYKSHVGIDRVYSMKVFSINFAKKFKDVSKFDVVYSAYPMISHNLHILNVIDRSKTKFIVDIQDVWPESFSAVVPAIRYIPIQLLPFSRSANKIYSHADGIVAVSQTYLNRAIRVNKSNKYLVAYLGTEFSEQKTIPISNSSIKLFYIGTISHSYDIKTVMLAVDILSRQGISIEFNIFGVGPHLAHLRSLDLRNTVFHGLVPYNELEGRLRVQHIAVNSIARGAPQSITNKLCDYLGLGCPILNSQIGWEVSELLRDRVHANYKAGNVESAAEAILSLISSPNLFNEWRFDDRFSRVKITEKIRNFIDEVSSVDVHENRI